MSAAVVDDHSLRALLLHEPAPRLHSLLDSREIWTTFGWYHRLCLAFAGPVRPGRLNGELVSMPLVRRRQAVEAVATLPAGVGIYPGRDVAWPMARLRHEFAPAVRLNFLAAEPLAAATLLGPDTVIVIAEGNVPPSLAAAAGREGIPVQTVPMR